MLFLVGLDVILTKLWATLTQDVAALSVHENRAMNQEY